MWRGWKVWVKFHEMGENGEEYLVFWWRRSLWLQMLFINTRFHQTSLWILTININRHVFVHLFRYVLLTFTTEAAAVVFCHFPWIQNWFTNWTRYCYFGLSRNCIFLSVFMIFIYHSFLMHMCNCQVLNAQLITAIEEIAMYELTEKLFLLLFSSLKSLLKTLLRCS